MREKQQLFAHFLEKGYATGLTTGLFFLIHLRDSKGIVSTHLNGTLKFFLVEFCL